MKLIARWCWEIFRAHPISITLLLFFVLVLTLATLAVLLNGLSDTLGA